MKFRRAESYLLQYVQIYISTWAHSTSLYEDILTWITFQLKHWHAISGEIKLKEVKMSVIFEEAIPINFSRYQFYIITPLIINEIILFIWNL